MEDEELTIVVSKEEYWNLRKYKRIVENKGKVVYERRTMVENGERHEELLVYTQEEYQEKIEQQYRLLFGDMVPPLSEQESQMAKAEQQKLLFEAVHAKRDADKMRWECDEWKKEVTSLKEKNAKLSSEREVWEGRTYFFVSTSAVLLIVVFIILFML